MTPERSPISLGSDLQNEGKLHATIKATNKLPNWSVYYNSQRSPSIDLESYSNSNKSLFFF